MLDLLAERERQSPVVAEQEDAPVGKVLPEVLRAVGEDEGLPAARDAPDQPVAAAEVPGESLLFAVQRADLFGVIESAEHQRLLRRTSDDDVGIDGRPGRLSPPARSAVAPDCP